jgi:hypothetical protein
MNASSNSKIQAVSLRGSLADKFHNMMANSRQSRCRKFIEELLLTNDPAVEKRLNDGVMIIGMHAEIGKFPPDW